ncbi:MAG TPA: glycosyltransferase family 4 protein [Longimicrobiales bacterium]
MGSNAMRILITTDVAGGVWSYTEELTDALLARGHTLCLVILGEPGAVQRSWLAKHRDLSVTLLPSPLEWEPEPEPGLSASVEALRRVVEAEQPDVIHLNQYYYGAFALGAPHVVVAHSDVVSWWRAVKREEPPADAWFRRYRRWVAEGLRGARVRVAPSRWIAQQIESIYGLGPVRVVYNGRSARRFRARRRARREPVVVAAGRLWDEAKGARDLIPAAALLAGRARVVLAGPATHPAEGEAFPVDAPGLEWVGMLDAEELRLLLSQARVYTATSRYEPFGLAPLEAALAGCALVLSDIPTFRELWDGCALFYAPGDAGALAEAALALLGDEDRRKALADAARARALSRYTPARMAERYEAVYRDAVESAAREPVAANGRR